MFIVNYNTAALPMYRLLIYRRSMQHAAPQVKITLQLTAVQLQWTVNANIQADLNKLTLFKIHNYLSERENT